MQEYTMMVKQNKLTFLPHQTKIMMDFDKYSVFVILWGRRSGKSTFCALLSCLKMYENQEYKVGYAVPDYNKISAIWSLINAKLKPYIKSSNLSIKTIELINGSTIEFMSLADDEGKGRSKYFNLLIIDEAALVRNLQPKLEYDLMPTLIDKAGKLVIVSTAQGGSNYFSKLYFKANSGGDPTWNCYKCTSYDNTTIPKEELDKFKLLPDDVYKQEILAEILPDQGMVFGDLSTITINKSIIMDSCVNTFGVDIASRVDNTSIIGLNKMNQVVSYNNFRGNWTEVKKKTLDIVGGIKTYMDQTGVGVAIFDDFQSIGRTNIYPFVLTHNTKQEIIQNLSIGIKNKLIWIPREYSKIIDELNSFEYSIRNGAVYYAAPSGYHDDDVISLSLAYYHNNEMKIDINDIFVGGSNLQF